MATDPAPVSEREPVLPRVKRAGAHLWREWVKPLLIVLLVTGVLRSALADWNDVPTGSMKPTILEGDRIWVNKLAYDLKVPFTTWHLAEWGAPARGEVVVFYSPHDGVRLVKRVVGLPGDVLEMRNGQLRLNGTDVTYEPLTSGAPAFLSEAEQARHRFALECLPGRTHPVMGLAAPAGMRDFGPVTVAAGHYFMMGDNRDNSFDSRSFGTVERGRIVGRASSVALSFDKSRHWKPRWNRFFSGLE